MSEESHHQYDSIADLWKENGEIYDAIAAKNNGITASYNFANMGKYIFSTKYEKSEILELYGFGNGWNVRNIILLIHLLKSLVFLRVLHSVPDN